MTATMIKMAPKGKHQMYTCSFLQFHMTEEGQRKTLGFSHLKDFIE